MVSEIQRDFALWPWLGMVDAARQHDVNFVTFIGGILRPMSGFGGQANVLCELAGTECLDGLIIWPPVMGGYLTQPEIEEFCRRYHPSLPVVLLQEVIQDIPRVTIDDYQGFCLAVDHLIETHGYRRIAFAGMFESHIGFRARYRAYTDTMAARGLPVEARLAKAWFPDEVIYPSGRIHEEVFDAWLGQVLKTGVDAIVGVCDTIALEIIELLKARGVRIPGDVAVASFDDFRQSQVVTPPLTTANPSFYELGQQAVEILLALLDGQSVPEEVVVPPRLMVRQSCGCMDPTVEQVAVGPVKASRKSFKAGLATRREEILAEMAQAMGASEAARERSEQLLDYFAAEVTGEPSGGFLRELDEGLQRAAGHDDIAAWQGAISALRRHALPYLGGETLSRAEDLWQQARVLIGQVAQRQQAYEELQAAQQADVLREIGAALITTFDVGELMDTLAQNLPGVGIPSCYLSLYEAPPPYQYPQPAPEWSWLILAYNKKGHIELETGGQRFRSRELMLKKLWPQDRPFSFVVESLYFQESQLGFVLFEVGPREGATYKALCTQISSAVQGALLVQRVQERSAALARQQYILDTFMANVPDSIYFKDRHSRITHANPAHARGLGLQYVADEIGKTDFDFFPEEQARPKYEREQEIIRSGRPVLALEEPCANGRWVLTTKMPLRDEKGEIVGTFGISRDITELKRMQVRLEKANVEISTLNERLKAENVRMEAELDVT
ncbi:MAG: substrate-binding domain-containing protein, partial [Thermoflexales bacterium]|nr:substrate-binding domain-containing protein [Thermoflexales bacterium]